MTTMGSANVLEDLAPERMEEAYLAFREDCYGIVHRSCVERGVLDMLRVPTTVEAFGAELGVTAEKLPVARLLLNALARYGAVRRLPGQPARFVAPNRPEPRPEPDPALIRLATGQDSAGKLRQGRSYASILDALTSEGNPIAADFTAGKEPSIDEMFTLPFYRYCRLQAVREVTAAGSRILDLACGPGFGLAELAERLPDGPGTTVLGIELTRAYVAAAAERTASHSRVAVLRGDLEEPQEFLRDGYFDGALMVGAYHYLHEPSALWDTVARVLRPGGVFCVGYVLSRVGSADQELMDLRFALREPPTYPVSPADLQRHAEDRGLRLTRTWGLGAWCWYAFVRP